MLNGLVVPNRAIFLWMSHESDDDTTSLCCCLTADYTSLFFIAFDFKQVFSNFELPLVVCLTKKDENFTGLDSILLFSVPETSPQTNHKYSNKESCEPQNGNNTL